MLNELQGLAKVVDDIKLAIEQDAPELIAAGFHAYGQYAFMLSAEGQHRHLMNKQLSLEAINLAFRQRLLMQRNDTKQRLSEESVQILLVNVPLTLPLCSKVVADYPASMSLLTEQIFTNPYWLSQSFDNSGSMVEGLISTLASEQPVMTQAILTRVLDLIDPQQIGSQFVDVLLNAIKKFDVFDSDFRASVNEKKRLIASALSNMVDSGITGIASIETVAKVKQLSFPELTSHLLSPEYMVTFDATQHKQLSLLAQGDLPFKDENIIAFLGFDQNRGVKHSFITCLFLANPDLFLSQYTDALMMSFDSQATKLAQGLAMIVRATELLKEVNLYDHSRFTALTEDLYDLVQKDERLAPGAATLFVRNLPEDVVKKSNLIEHPGIARELLESELGL